MGYEVKVIIGTLGNMIEEDGKSYFFKIAEFDLCKVDLECSSIAKSKGGKLLGRLGMIEAHPVYFYGTQEDKITEDRYGESLLAIEPQVLLKELIEKAKSNPYRRFPPLINLLSTMLETWGEKFYVVLYGH
jgi:hypothetical protein